MLSAEFARSRTDVLDELTERSVAHPTPEYCAIRQAMAIQWFESGSRLGRIKAPTLVVTGSADMLIPPAHSQMLAERIPNSTLKILPGADNARNFSQCDSMLIGDRCGAHTFPYIEVKNTSSMVEHEASTSKIGEDQIFYCQQRGMKAEDAVNMIVNGFCKEVFRELPMEFAVEAQKLLQISLEGSVG